MLIKNCLQCHTVIHKKNNCSLKNWAERVKYCSKNCSNLYRKGKISASPNTTFKKGQQSWRSGKENPDFRGQNNPMWKGGQINKRCLVCLTEYQVDRYRKDISKFCSKKCSNSSKKGKRFSTKTEFKRKYGVKDLNKIRLQVRNLNKTTLWRKNIFERDGYKCVLCGNGGKLQADHYPQSFAKILDIIIKECKEKYILRNAQKSKILFDISNGRTLCVKCHYKTDNYGAKGILR